MFRNSDQTRGTLEMALAMVLSGTLGFFVIESGQKAFDVVFFRCLFGAGFLFVYCLLRGFFIRTGFTKKTLSIAIIGGVALVSNWVLLFSSFSKASISISTAVYHTQPFFLLLIGAVVLRDKIPGNKLVWITFAFFGVVLVSNTDFTSFSFSADYLTGLSFALSAAILYAIATIITKQLNEIKPHLIALVQVSVGIILLLPFANLSVFGKIETNEWGYLLILGGVHTCFMYIIMYSAFQKLPTPTIAVMSFIYPIVAIGVDYIFYAQSLSTTQFFGIGLIIFASFAVNRNLSVFGLKSSD